MASMIITHTQNTEGQRRIYLGGKSSLECWIEPRADGQTWTFHLDSAITGQELTDTDRRAWAIHTLKALADELAVAPADLAAVPFEVIAALHSIDPQSGRRIANGRRQAIVTGFMAAPPGKTKPRTEFHRRHADSAGRQ